jgi:hypothetical protein
LLNCQKQELCAEIHTARRAFVRETETDTVSSCVLSHAHAQTRAHTMDFNLETRCTDEAEALVASKGQVEGRSIYNTTMASRIGLQARARE